MSAYEYMKDVRKNTKKEHVKDTMKDRIHAYLVVKFMSVELLCVNCLIFQYQFAVQNVVVLK